MNRATLLLATTLAAAATAAADVDGPTGTSRQPLVAGDRVGRAMQEELGLVRVGDDCSGTLLNTYWVITANHCVTLNGVLGGPQLPLNQIVVTATWRKGDVAPTRIVEFWSSKSLDVALLFLGGKNFGSRERKRRLIFHDKVYSGMTLTKFGRGICTYATESGSTAVPARRGCGYRMAGFSAVSASERSIEFQPNDAGQIMAGGDSGGPDYVTDDDGNPLSIAGISSTCVWTVIDGKPFGWMWANGVSKCSSAALATIRDNIHHFMKETPPPLPGGIVAAPPADAKDSAISRDKGVVTRSKSPYVQ